MDDLRLGGRTVLFVSHNMSAIQNLCPRAIWIEGGKVVKDGESEAVIREYLAMFAGSQQTGHDLSRIESRGGNGAVRFSGIEYLDAEGNPVNVIRAGESVRVRLHFHANEQINHPHFGFKIFSDVGTLITTISTWATGLEIPRLPVGDGWVDLKLDCLNTMPSRYFVSLWLSGLGGVKYDALDHCAALDVEPGDPYGTGKGIESRFGLVYLTGKWTYSGRV
jgi:lipopolysaccharide transport system ATP-binding protein